MIQGSRFRVESTGERFQVSDFGVRGVGFKKKVSSFEFWVLGFRFRVSGFGFRVSGLGFESQEGIFLGRGETIWFQPRPLSLSLSRSLSLFLSFSLSLSLSLHVAIHGGRVDNRKPQVMSKRSVSYRRTTSASNAPSTSRRTWCPTHCANYCVTCQPTGPNPLNHRDDLVDRARAMGV